MQRGLTYDDVALVPQFNNVPSRSEPDLHTWLTRNQEVSMPLIPANMESVIGPQLAQVILDNGGIPILHRFCSVEEQAQQIEMFVGRVFISAGLNDWETTCRLLSMKPIGVCFDVAHGHSQRMLEAIRKVKEEFPTCEVIAGNVCSPMAYQDLVNAGADAVKVGVGPGAACTTRVRTGFGVPQFTAIQQCAEVAQKLRAPIIADGGIRNSRDLVLALAAGASTAMVGKLFSLTNESSAEKHDSDGSIVARYRGQASASFQTDFYGGLKEKTVAEGVDFWAPVSGPAQDVIDELLGGLRSGLTYGGARSIKELQRKAEFMEVTPTYGAESNPRS